MLKWFSLLTALMAALLFAGCGGGGGANDLDNPSGPFVTVEVKYNSASARPTLIWIHDGYGSEKYEESTLKRLPRISGGWQTVKINLPLPPNPQENLQYGILLFNDFDGDGECDAEYNHWDILNAENRIYWQGDQFVRYNANGYLISDDLQIDGLYIEALWPDSVHP